MRRFATIAADLSERGLAVRRDFLPAAALAALSEDARRIMKAGGFHQAGVGASSASIVRADIRGDRIHWLEAADLTPAQRVYWDELETLRAALNEELFLGLATLEAHYAVYPPGAFYRRHVDRFATYDERMLSCTLYLNAGWKTEEGGQLRLYLESGEQDILPCAGTFVIFRSDSVAHEVLPATRERWSITGWFKRRSLRRIVSSGA